MNAIEIIKESKIEGNILRLPNIQLNRKEYEEVKKLLTGIGGNWKGGKISGFVFESSPSNDIDKLVRGEKINYKKDFQFFETPPNVLKDLISQSNLKNGLKILEPSAGRGAIINSIINEVESVDIYYCELMENNLNYLKDNSKGICIGQDFMELKTDMVFDRIIANPPFTKNQDITHLRKMYDLLTDGGILSCITSTSWYYGNTKKQNEFKDWLNSKEHTLTMLEQGEFKSSGTNVGTIIVTIYK